MAYLAESELQKQQRLQQQGQDGQQAQGAPMASGPSGVITGGAPQAQGKPGQPTRSGAFTNISSYLNANRPQTAQLTQQVAGNVANQNEQAKTQVDNVNNQFKTQADASGAKRDQQFVQSTVGDAVNAVKDQNTINRFNQMRTAEYKGPQSVADVDGYADAQNKLTNAQTALKNTDTEAGRFSLVQEQFKRPSYNRGQQSLDQALLQNDPTARTAFSDLRSKYAGLNDYLGNVTTQSQQYAQQRQADTQAARQDVTEALGTWQQGGALGALNQQLATKQKQAADDQARLLKQAQTQMASGTLDRNVADSLGIKDSSYLYNLDLGAYGKNLAAGDDQITQADIADDNQMAQLSALQQLGGIDPSTINLGEKRGKAGVNFDSKGFNSALTNSRREAMLADVAKINQLMSDGGTTMDDFGTNLQGSADASARIQQMIKEDPSLAQYLGKLSDLGKSGYNNASIGSDKSDPFKNIKRLLVR